MDDPWGYGVYTRIPLYPILAYIGAYPYTRDMGFERSWPDPVCT